MRKSLSFLIEVALSMQEYFEVHCFELHEFEDGGYVDFNVTKIPDVKDLLSLSKGLLMRCFHCENGIIVRIFEDFNG